MKAVLRLEVTQSYLKTYTTSLIQIKIMEFCCLNCTLGGSEDKEMGAHAKKRESSRPSPECIKRRKLSDDPGNVVFSMFCCFALRDILVASIAPIKRS